MNPHAGDDPGTSVVAGRHGAPVRSVRVGRLLSLLEGEGLDKNTIEELLRPESLMALQTFLTDRPFGAVER